jgi:hypothetical protein
MAIPATDVVLTESAAEALDALIQKSDADKAAASILKRVQKLKPILLADALHGEVVKKPLPEALVAKHGVTNLYVEDLPSFWRLVYTVVRDEMRPHVVIVEIVDHKQYDKWFPGRGR